MSTPNQITIDSNINDISIGITNNTIEVVDNNCPAEIIITQPVTRVVEIATVGPLGPVGPRGLTTFFIATGSVSASVALTGDIFTISSASTDIFSVNYQGVAILQETITDPDPIRGGIFFSTTGDFYFGS
jgi:hypothetical protein